MKQIHFQKDVLFIYECEQCLSFITIFNYLNALLLFKFNIEHHVRKNATRFDPYHQGA